MNPLKKVIGLYREYSKRKVIIAQINMLKRKRYNYGMLLLKHENPVVLRIILNMISTIDKDIEELHRLLDI